MGSGETTITISFAGDDKYATAEDRTISVIVKCISTISDSYDDLIKMLMLFS